MSNIFRELAGLLGKLTGFFKDLTGLFAFEVLFKPPWRISSLI